MKTILMTAYAINPYKGSEDGMGWNFVLQAARYNKVIAVTRKNNGPHIEKYAAAHPELAPQLNNVRFLYFDWPAWLIWWKKGPLLSLIYYYGWQFTLACWLLARGIKADIVHNLNFHNDWTPTFLWLLRKPLVWGPVGHHPRIPKSFIRPVFGQKENLKDAFLWALKKTFWYLDPFLKLTVLRSAKVLCMNSDAAKRLRLPASKFAIIPSVASEEVTALAAADKDQFTVLSVGRFVPLKGFDLSISAFAAFYRGLSPAQQVKCRLKLVGTGPSLPLLKRLIASETIEAATDIIEWIPRPELDALYAKASLFLFPSHEGAGMVVAEAMSWGLPVVCLDNSGPGQFIHPASGSKVPVTTYQQTIQQLAQKLHALYSYENYYQHERELSLQRFQTQFRWQVRGNQLKAVYDGIAVGRSNPGVKTIFQ